MSYLSRWDGEAVVWRNMIKLHERLIAFTEWVSDYEAKVDTLLPV